MVPSVGRKVLAASLNILHLADGHSAVQDPWTLQDCFALEGNFHGKIGLGVDYKSSVIPNILPRPCRPSDFKNAQHQETMRFLV